jgi:4-diphosphocytidyl-2-C-methyl-D-erythritol kinase
MKILSPAKINLFLQVTGKRPDGYHELFSLMCCVSLYDTIYLQLDTDQITIDSSHPNLPLNETNLAHKAAALFFKTLGVSDGVKITIEKKIPVAAGLGGGSSNAASVLRGLNHYYGHPFSREQLSTMGLCLGADVPFLLYRKPAFATGVGEKLEPYTEQLPYHVIIVYPGFEVSTAQVFQNLNLRLTKCKKKIKKPFSKKTGFDAALHLCNDLEAVTISKHPEIKFVKEELIRQRALGALMSGSGPSVFGLFSDPDITSNAMKVFGHNSRWSTFSAKIIRKENALGSKS